MRVIWLGFLGFVVLGKQGLAEVSLASRQIMVLYPAVDQVRGSYILSVNNTASESLAATIKVSLPKEVVNWFPQEGIAPNEVRLDDQTGGLLITKTFPSNSANNNRGTLINFGFVVEGSLGKTALTLQPSSEIGLLTVLTRKGQGLVINSDRLSVLEETPVSGYDAVAASEAVQPGQTLKISISGLPEGRGRFWLVGSVLGALILVGGFAAAARTRPKFDTRESLLANVEN